MNPSYNAGGSGIPGAKPGVIASGPDDGEKPGVIASGAGGEKSSVIAGAGGGRIGGGGGTGARFGAGMPNPMPIMPANAGMKMPKKSNSKIFLIIGGILIAIMVVILIVLSVMPKGGSAPGTPRVTFGSIYNYLVFGSSDTNDANEYSVENPYFAEMAYSESYEEQEKYFTNAIEQIENLKNTLNDDSLKEQIIDFENTLSVIKEVSLVAYTNVLSAQYFEDGEKSFDERIKNNEQLNLSDNGSFYAAIVTVEQDLIRKTSELYKRYESLGCKGETSFDNDCVDKYVVENETINSTIEAINRLRVNLRRYDNIFIEQAKVELTALREEL